MATDRLINKDQGDSMITALGNIATNINTITYGPQTSADKVVSMTGYQKSSAATPGAISQGDTLNEAVGKLEKKVDNNATAIAGKIESYTDATTSGHVVTFNNSTGTQVTDSGVSIATSTTGVTDVDTTIPTSKSVVAYAATKDHTHNYAGSSSAGGAATSADKLNIGSSNIGSATQPVYFDKTTGKPVAITNTIQSNVPADAVFTDTTYTVATGTQNGKIKVTPSVGSAYEVPVYGLGAAAYKGVADTVSTSTDLVTSTAVNTKLASYVPNSDFVVAENNILYNTNMGVKNLLASLLRVATVGSSNSTITFALQGDGSIVLNGSTTSSVAIFVITESGKWATTGVNGVDESFENISYKIALFDGGNASGSGVYLDMYHSGWTDRATCGVGGNTTFVNPYILRLCVPENKTLTNVRVKPMVCTLDAWNQSTDYQLPSLPNYDLTLLEAGDRVALAEEIDAGAKNIAVPKPFGTVSGLTVTENNGTYTITGTTSSSFTIKLWEPTGGYTCTTDMVVIGPEKNNVAGTVNYCVQWVDSSNTYHYDLITVGSYKVVPKGGKIDHIYLQKQGTTSATLDIKINLMCCTKAAFGVSSKFVPYRPNYDLVCNRYNSTCLIKTYEYTPTAADTYEELPPLKITLPSGKMLRITASAIFQIAYAKGIMLIRGNTVGDTYTLAKEESDVGLNTLAVSTAYTAGSAQDIHVYVKANSKAAIKVVVVYDII